LRGNTCVRHDHVETPEFFDRGGYGRLYLIAIRHIASLGGRVTARAADLSKQLGLQTGNRDPRAPLMQPASKGRANATSGPRDEHALARQRWNLSELQCFVRTTRSNRSVCMSTPLPYFLEGSRREHWK
jgi:hypothetical protein